MKRHALALAMLLVTIAACGKERQPEFQESIPPGNGTTAPAQAPATAVPPALPPTDGDHAGAPPTGAPPAPEPLPVERQLIRTGQVSIRVASLDSAQAGLARIATANGGYTASSSRSREQGATLSGATELRFPTDKFDQVLAGVRSLGEVLSESINTADVTQEYIDLNARLKTQQELEARLLKLLEDRTGKLADVVEVETKLAEVRTQIEGIQGRLRYLQNQISYSTLTVNMVEPGAAGTSQTETFGGRIAHAFEEGIDGLIDTLGVLIVAAIALLPIIAIALLLYYFLYRPWRRRRQAKGGNVKDRV